MKATQQDHTEEVGVYSILTFLGGIALGFSFPPFSFGFLAWVAFAPMLVLWERSQSFVRLMAELFTAFLLMFAIGFFWPLLHTYSSSSVVTLSSLLFVPILLSLPLLLSQPIRKHYGRLAGFSAFAAMYLSVEFGLTYVGAYAFPWPLLGHTQANLIYFNQFAEFTGLSGLTFWVLLVNGLVYALIVSDGAKIRRRLLPSFALIVVLGGAFGFSYWRTHIRQSSSPHITVGLVQPSMDDVSWTSTYGAVRLTRLFDLSDELIGQMGAPPILMVWPEMAIPSAANEDHQVALENELRNWTTARDVALLTGELAPTATPGNSRSFYNRAVLYGPNILPQRYDQVIALPFESVAPVEDNAPWLETNRVSFSPPIRSGSQQQILSFDDIRIGVLLGFEVLLGEYARKYIVQDAAFFASLTTKGWWGNTPGYEQHLSYLRIRAIETRRTIIQVGSKGSTAVISPEGSISFESSSSNEVVQLAAIPLSREITLYAAFGNWLSWLALALSAIFLVLSMVALKPEKKDS